MKQTSNKKQNKKSKKQILAIIGIAAIIFMALLTLFAAFFDSTGHLFSACMVAMIGLPILLWICIWVIGYYEQKNSIASFDLHFSKDESDSEP